VEDAARAVALRVVRELGAEPAIGLDLTADEPVEAEEGNRGDLPARVERAANDSRLGVGEGVRHVPHVADARVALAELVADFEQFGLPPDLAADDVLDPLEVLYALHLDAGAVGDGDVHVLPDRPESALDRARRAEQHADALGGLAGALGTPDVRPRPDLDEGNAEPVERVDDAPPRSPRRVWPTPLRA